MKNSIELIRGFVRDERGATAIEYALIASIISIAIAAVAISLGETVRDELFGKVAAALGV
jgi:pilus assembly protein Flp/PilA